jgi:drug/metabolite transporter (DMT)-like permease
MFAGICVFCLPLAWVTARAPADLVLAYASLPAWVALGVLIVFSTLGGYLLMNRWQPAVSATEAGLVYCAEPVFASLLALFLPACYSRLAGIDYANERVSSTLLIGGGLITLANALIQLQPPRRPNR